MPPATKKKRPTDSMDLESDEEPYERKARKQMAQSKLAFGKQAETPAAAPSAAADDSDDDDDDDDLDMSFLGGSSSAKAEEKPAKSRFSDVHSDKPKSKPEPKSMSKTKASSTAAAAAASPATSSEGWRSKHSTKTGVPAAQPKDSKKATDGGMKQSKLTISGGVSTSEAGEKSKSGSSGGGGSSSGSKRASAGDDLLSSMLSQKEQQEHADDEMRERVAVEVDQMMDNGVKINPLLRGLYGGSGKAK